MISHFFPPVTSIMIVIKFMFVIVIKFMSVTVIKFMSVIFLTAITFFVGEISSQTCPQIILPPYAKFLRQPCPTYTGARCYLTCEVNFDMIGSCFRTCGQSGEWSGVNIICTRPSVQCPPLEIPSGVILKSGCQNMAGFSCEFGCSSNSPPTGPSNIYCQVNGRWSGLVPSCGSNPVTIPCPQIPPPPDGAFVTGSCPVAGSQTCSVVCNPGFAPTPSASITCGTNGAWSGPVPRCSPLTQCPPVQIANGFVAVGTCAQSASSVGSTCSLICNSGFSASGPTQIQCIQTGWSPPVPKCVQSSCPPLNAPINGQILGQCIPGLEGQICRFRCLPGFKIQGSDSLTCKEGKWSQSSPTCILAGCAPLPVPQGGLWKLGNTFQPNFECPGDVGSVCELLCANGFVIQGPSTTRCISDTFNSLRWDPIPTPTCVAAG